MTTTHRRLMSLVVLDRLRSQHGKLLDQLQRKATPAPATLGSYLTDVSALIDAYELATDRLRTVQRVLDGDQ